MKRWSFPLAVALVACSGDEGADKHASLAPGDASDMFLDAGDGGSSKGSTSGGSGGTHMSSGSGGQDNGDPSCVAKCGTQQCGFDSKCGKSCGSCDTDSTCEAGTCVKHCDLDVLTADTTLDLDIAELTVSGTITLGGKPLPESSDTSQGSRAFVTFVPKGQPNDQTRADLGVNGPANYTAKIVKGTYDVVLVPGQSGVLPSNITLEHDVAIDADRTRDYDVATVSAEVTLSMDGAPLPDDASNPRGALQFVSKVGSWTTRSDFAAPATVHPTLYETKYDVWFEGFGSSSLVPAGNARLLAADWTPDAPQTFDIATARLSGEITFEGKTFPDNCCGLENNSRASLFLRDLDSGRMISVDLHASGKASFDVLLLQGRYQVLLHANDQTFMPGAGALLETELEIKGDVARSWDLHALHRSGNVTLKNQPPMALVDGISGVYGNVRFRNLATGQDATAPLTDDKMGHVTYALDVLPGDYDVIAESLKTSDMLNVDGLPFKQHWTIAQAGDEDLTLDPIRLQTTITLDGKALPENSSTTIGHGFTYVALLDQGVNQTVYGNPAPPPTFALLAGRAVIEVQDTGPRNPFTSARTALEIGKLISSDTTSSYDLHVVTVSGTVTRNGQPLPDSSDGTTSRGDVEAVDAVTGSVFSTKLSASGPATFSMQLLAGAYDFRFATPIGLAFIDERFTIVRGCRGERLQAQNCKADPANLTGTWTMRADYARDFDVIELEQNGTTLHASYLSPKAGSRVDADAELDGDLVAFHFPICNADLTLKVVSGCVLLGSLDTACDTANVNVITLYR